MIIPTRWRLAPLILVIALIAFGNSHAAAQSSASVQLRVPFHVQDTLVWCWVASAKMAIEAAGKRAPSQCAMLSQAYGVPCCDQPWLCERGGYMVEIQALIARFGGRISDIGVSHWAPDYLNHLHATKKPIVAHVDGSHFVVITGMRIFPSPWGPQAEVTYHDPFRGRDLREPWTQFAPRVSHVLAVR